MEKFYIILLALMIDIIFVLVSLDCLGFLYDCLLGIIFDYRFIKNYNYYLKKMDISQLEVNRRNGFGRYVFMGDYEWWKIRI